VRKAAFFDRDGTINVNFGHVYKPEDLVFVQGTPEIIADYNRQGVPVIVVTNQAGIARGLYTEDDMHRFHTFMNERLKKEYGAHIDAFYFCPHHPDFTGPCDCRKPKPGMFIHAAIDWNIDLNVSVMYGDKESDREASRLAGIPTFCFVRGV
jgi:D,D-heptose 1,7-bisphosphate phosphatase